MGLHTVAPGRVAAIAAVAPTTDDERSLLVRLDALLEREEALLAAPDADGLFAIADEREQLTARLGDAARARRLATANVVDAELVALYDGIRRRYALRAQVVRRRAERNQRAVGVLAQVSGNAPLYDAGGRVPLKFAPA